MRRSLARTAALLALAWIALFAVAPAHAWEFELAGAFNWTYEWYSQMGTKGFFGPWNSNAGAGTPGAANLNFWNGGQFDTNISTSSRAGWSYFNVEFLPKFKLNPAIQFAGKYRLGMYGNPIALDYYTFDAPGTNNAFSEGQWTMFWASVQTPLGVLGIGKRPWTFGTGLQYDGDDACSTESVSLVAPYGPLDIGIAFYPYRYAGSSGIPQYFGLDPFDLPRFASVRGMPVRGQYFSQADSGGTLGKDFLVLIKYYQGALSLGAVGSILSFHIGPEAVLQNPSDPTPMPALDSSVFHGSAFVKYDNGRFFFNGEAAWLYWTDRWSDPTGIVGPPNPLYIEQWRYMAELGVICGPAKVSLFGAWTPGPDRRNGLLIDRQPAAFVRHPTFDCMLGNFDVFRPYSHIFSFNYGSGLNAYNLSGDGYVLDAFVLAARLDYAVAANLNVFGSFFHAERTSNGYSWGCIGPNAGVGSFLSRTPTGGPDGNVSFVWNRYPASPNIPDRSLGYEVDIGFDWKLLEGMTLGVLIGYWQPGKWFNYAAIDRSVPAWWAGDAGNLYGTKPDRRVDPVIGGNVYLKLDF